MEAVARWEGVSRPLSHLPLVQLQVEAALSARAVGKPKQFRAPRNIRSLRDKHPALILLPAFGCRPSGICQEKGPNLGETPKRGQEDTGEKSERRWSACPPCPRPDPSYCHCWGRTRVPTGQT